MKAGFFSKLAFNSIRKNARLYIPYWITCTLCVCMYYLMLILSVDPAIIGMRGGRTTAAMLGLGSIVLAFFSVLFLFYTNSFLLRRRKQEFGLYSVLGMDRRSIGRILLWETIITAGVVLTAGIGFGMALSKMGELLLMRLVGNDAVSGFFLSGEVIGRTLLFFGIVLGLLLLNGIRQVRFAAVTDLLKSTHAGEKPVKANRIVAALGVVLLGAAYYMAITVQSPLTALMLFFAAVLMVILATYLLMISGSVVLCRILEKNKAYYYRTKHFVSVSSMKYRMKRNGAGLASICILATMVLVMIAFTACLYFGAEDSIQTTYPREFNITVELDADDGTDAFIDSVRAMTDTVLSESGYVPEDRIDSSSRVILGALTGDQAVLDPEQTGADPLLYEKLVAFSFVDISAYNSAMGTDYTVPEGKLMVYSPRTPFDGSSLTMDTVTYDTVMAPAGFTYTSTLDTNITPAVYLFTNDLDGAVEPLKAYRNQYDNALLGLSWRYCFNVDAAYDELIAINNRLWNGVGELMDPDRMETRSFSISIRVRTLEKEDFYATYGGFFFLGILLSIVFLTAATVIIYYKQLSEGYEDQGRFAILRKVGMTRQDIRSSVNSQMLTVFLVPLGLAILHLCFAFPMLRNILILFNVSNLNLLFGTAAASAGIFALFYVVVYRITAGVYYRLVAFDDR